MGSEMRRAEKVQRNLENCGAQGNRTARKVGAAYSCSPMGPGSLAWSIGKARGRESPQEEEEGKGQKEVNLALNALIVRN